MTPFIQQKTFIYCVKHCERFCKAEFFSSDIILLFNIIMIMIMIIIIIRSFMLIDHRLGCWDTGVKINSGLNSRTSVSNHLNSSCSTSLKLSFLTIPHFLKQFIIAAPDIYFHASFFHSLTISMSTSSFH